MKYLRAYFQLDFLVKFYFTNKYSNMSAKQIEFYKSFYGSHKCKSRLRRFIWNRSINMIIKNNK